MTMVVIVLLRVCTICLFSVAYPEFVSGEVSKSRKFKWLVKAGVSKGVTPDLNIKKTIVCIIVIQ